MQIQITDIPITTFDEILKLKSNIISGNRVDVSSHQSILNSFNERLSIRPMLKKPCIKTIINLGSSISKKQAIYIIKEYVQEIKWDDLQYAGFLNNSNPNTQIYLFFSRITFDKNKVIDLKFLHKDWQEIQILEKAVRHAQSLNIC